MLRVLLWLGLEQDQSEWARAAPGGEVAVFAETYENNVGCFVCVVAGRLYIYIYMVTIVTIRCTYSPSHQCQYFFDQIA